MTWAEEIRPLLEQSLRLVDKQPTEWTLVVATVREALSTVPSSMLPLGATLGIGLNAETLPAEQCRHALSDCLGLLQRARYEEAVSRLQDAWQSAEQNEGL